MLGIRSRLIDRGLDISYFVRAMRRILLSILALIPAGLLAQGEVPLPLKVGKMTTRDGKVFENAVIVSEDEVGVKVQHDGGLARVAYQKLPPYLTQKFAASAEAGKQVLAENEKKAKEWAEANPAPPKEERKAPKAATDDESVKVEEIPQEEAEPVDYAAITKRILNLEAYIERQRKEVTAAQERAAAIMARGDIRENSQRYVNQDRLMRMAEKYWEKARKADEMVRKAEVEIGKLQAKLAEGSKQN